MESPNLSGPSASELTIQSEQAKIKERDHLFSNRSTWKSRRDCIQAYFCFLMSFGNGLQFGASIGKYGFLIFIPYAICNVFVGIPAVLVEVIMSRYVMKDIAEAWNMCPLARSVLWILLGTTVISITNNFVYLVYLIKYFFASFTDRPKWGTCDSPWNTITCYKAGKRTNALNNCLKNHSESFCMALSWETSGTQFWKYEIADKTSVVVDVSFVICLLVTICFIAIIIFKDIRSLEKMLILLVAFPIILGIILTWVSFSIPEALVGFKQIFVFNWDWLLHPQIWVEGLEDTLLFLGLGDLSVTLVSSHGEFADDIFTDVVIITFGGFLFCIFLMIPILSVSAGSRGKQLINENFHLKLFKDKEDVFTSISDALTLYPFPNSLWSAFTYLNWFLIALSAQAVLILAVCDIFIGMIGFDFTCTMLTFLILSFFTTICGMFFNFEFTLDLGSIALVVIVLFTITWQLFYGAQKFNYDFFFMMGYPLPIYIKCSWFTLLILPLTALIFKLYLGIPDKPFKYVYCAYVGIPCFVYILGFIGEIGAIQYKGEKVSRVFFANPNWGPDNSLLKKSRIILASGNVNREYMYRQELNKKPFKKHLHYTDQNIVQLI